MAVTLLFQKVPTKIDSLTLDAALSEHHGVQVEVTQHPVEKGPNISDHRRPKPRVVTLEGIVSNTPMPQPNDPSVTTVSRGIAFASRSKYDPTRVGTAYQQLLDLSASDQLITIVTGLETYDNMTMVSLDVPRDARTGEALNFTAVFTEIIVVENALVTVKKARTTRGQGKADLHKKNGQTTPPEQQTTFLKDVKDALSDPKTRAGLLERLHLPSVFGN